jgi:hypothetical protein
MAAASKMYLQEKAAVLPRLLKNTALQSLQPIPNADQKVDLVSGIPLDIHFSFTFVAVVVSRVF